MLAGERSGSSNGGRLGVGGGVAAAQALQGEQSRNAVRKRKHDPPPCLLPEHSLRLEAAAVLGI